METGPPTWRPRAWLVAAGVPVVLALALSMVGVHGPVVAWVVALVAVAIAVSVAGWALLRTRSQRRRYEEELATWATDRATQNEQLRIAGDLHDLVSHGLGLITVRAAVARRITGPNGESERADALTDIERLSRETTTELRRMLTVLRTPGAVPLRPSDTLEDLPAIVQAANAAGLTATLGIEHLGDVSPGAQLLICAVVREALNNTVRHAGRTRVSVEVRRDGEVIVVDAQDAGPCEPWQPQPGAGHGLDGLRERVATLGGTLHAEPDEHGFHLLVRIPDQDHT